MNISMKQDAVVDCQRISTHDDSIHYYSIETQCTDSVTVTNIVISCFLIHACSIVGSLGNVITLIVLSQKRIKDTSTILLLSLATCDLAYLVSLSARKLDCIIGRFDPVLAHIYTPYAVRYGRFPSRLPMLISVNHIVIISFERVIAVFYPLKLSQMITRRKTITVLVITYVVWIAYTIPRATLIFRIEWTYSSTYNRTLPLVKLTKWYIKNKNAIDILSSIVANAATVAFSVIVAVNCCAIAYKLHLVSKQRKLLSCSKVHGTGNDVRVSKMLLTVCIVFCLCIFPSSAIFGYLYWDDTPSKRSDRFSVLLNDLEELFLAINSAGNFFIYVLMSSRFYNSVISLIGCRNGGKRGR